MNTDPKSGFVYILSHPVWSNIGGTGAIKIGKTGIDPSKRALQIASASGLLRQPTVEWCCWVADRGAVERAVHRQLHCYRVSKRRELFAVSVATARSVIEKSTDTRTLRVSQQYKRPGRCTSKLIGLLIAAGSAILAWMQFQ